jgi:osmotically-inducible protein OsmY
MKTNLFRLAPIVACMSAMLMATPAIAQTATPSADDLENRIEQRWETDTQLKNCKGCDIDVEVENGIAKLTGEVPSTALKARAERLARVQGVATVQNQITIGTAKSAAEKTRGGLNKAADKTGEGLSKAAEKTGEGVKKAAKETGKAVSTTGEVITDSWITGKVKGKITSADELDGSSIDVSTKDHVVTLSGTVKSSAQRDAAVRLARGIEGVKDVIDRTTVTQ